MAANKAFKKVKKSLQEAGVRFVHILWCDYGVGISAGQQGVPVMYDAVIPETGLGPVGEIRLVPDWFSFTPLPYTPGHARVMGNMVLNGSPWALCPRNFLVRMIEAARCEGLEIKAAFENEFYLLRQTSLANLYSSYMNHQYCPMMSAVNRAR